MALAQFPFKRVGRGVAAIGTFHRRGIMYHGWVPDPSAQVHTQLMQCLFVLPVRRTEVCNTNGRHAVCGAAFRNIDKSTENISRIYV